MAFSTERKAEIIKEHQKHAADTASPEVQIALLSERLTYLNDHFKTNEKDHHSRRGLMKLVGQRRQLLNYLQKRDNSAYKALISKLGIRK